MVSIKGYKSQQALQQKLAGYSEDQSIDKLRYTTIQEMSGRRHGLDVVIHGAYQITTVPKTIEAGSNIRTIKITSHGAKANDIVRLSDGTQFAALSVPDANTIITSVELDVSPVADTCTIWRHITPSYDSSGNAITTQGPVQFIDNNILTQVKNDDSVPANNNPLPSAMMIKKDDGIWYPVTLDTTSPYNHTPIPVCITDVTGTTNVTINAGDIAVGIKHNGADPSSVRIGDGTNLAAVSALNALKVDSAWTTQPVSNAALNVDTAASGSITGTASAQIATTNYGTVAFTVEGTWTGTITVELSQDNSTWYPTTYVSLATGNSSNTFTANTSGQANVVGYAYFRLKGATVSSGTAFVNFIASNKVSNVMLDNPLPAGSNNIGNINNITGTITLPSGAATSTLQTTGNSSLSSIDTKTPALGQALAAASTPVVLTAAQMTTLTPLSTVTINPLTNTSIVKAQLQDNTGAAITLGQQLSASSVPVVLPAAQITTLTPPAAITGFALDTTTAKLNIAQGTALGTNTGPMVQASVVSTSTTYTAGNISPLTVNTSGLLKVISLGAAATYVQSVTLDGVTAQTFAPPAAAKWVKIQADDNNSVSLRICMGGTATSTNGHLFAPGRSEDFPAVATISVIAVSTATAQMISITWG